MKYAILGATGGTGLCLIRQALDEGHEVTAIVRNPAKLSDFQHEKFKLNKVFGSDVDLKKIFSVIFHSIAGNFCRYGMDHGTTVPLSAAVEGNVFSAESLQPHLEGCDAVFSCLGTKSSMFSATTIYSAPMKAIVTAMRGAQVKRLLVISSWWVKVDPNDKPGFLVRWILRPMAAKVLRDVADMETFLEDECQDLDFTLIRPGWLTDAPKSEGKEYVVDIGRQFCDSVDKISRADVANFLLQNVETEGHYKKGVAIGLKA